MEFQQIEQSKNMGVAVATSDEEMLEFTCQCQAYKQDPNNLHTVKFIESKNHMVSSFIDAIVRRRGPKLEYFKMEEFGAFFKPKFQQLCFQLEICTEANKEICSLIEKGDKEKLKDCVCERLSGWSDDTWECGKRFMYSVEDLIIVVFGHQNFGEGDPEYAGSWFVEEYIASLISYPTKYLWEPAVV